MRRSILLCFLSIALAPANAGANSVGVVFGSYTNLHYAEEKQIEVEERLSVRTVVLSATGGSPSLFRVIGISSDHDAALRIANSAESIGIDTWLINLERLGYSNEVLMKAKALLQKAPDG